MANLQTISKRILTAKELKAVKKRLAIIDLVRKGLTYREIAAKMKISTTTIVRLNQRLKIKNRKLKGKIKKEIKKQTKKKSISVKRNLTLPWKFG